MRQSITLISKKRGPKPKGAIGVLVRMPPDQIAALDGWAAQHPDIRSRPEAIRRLIEAGLAAQEKIPISNRKHVVDVSSTTSRPRRSMRAKTE